MWQNNLRFTSETGCHYLKSLLICWQVVYAPGSCWLHIFSAFEGNIKLFSLDIGSKSLQTVADPDGVYLNPPPPPSLNIPWKWNNLVSLRPNYFVSMGQSETKLFHFHETLKRNEIKSAKRIPSLINLNPLSRNPEPPPPLRKWSINKVTYPTPV